MKQHTLLDLRGNIPSFIFTSDGKLHDRCAFKLDLARVTKKLKASPALAGRIVFQMDPATSAHQGVLRDERERGQVRIALSVYVLVAIVKKRLNLSASLYEIL